MKEIEQCLLELSDYDESTFAKENAAYLESKAWTCPRWTNRPLLRE